MEEETTPPRPRKTRRNPRACDVCSRRSVRCQASQEDPGRCQSCVDYGETCTFDRPLRKRGAKPKQRRTDDDAQFVESNNTSTDTVQGQAHTTPSDQSPELFRPTSYSSEVEWTPSISVSQTMVMDMIRIYFEVAYPVFPFFHQQTLILRVSRGEYLINRAFFASVMAICALSSARARDGALYSAEWDTQSLQEPSSEMFFKAAEDAIPPDATFTQNFDYMRSCVLLAVTSIQYGKTRLMSHYLGLYNSFVAVGRLHDEANWPRNLGIVEIEERRRLFWSTYSFDIFTSVIWGGIMRSREACSNVPYPTEVDDETFDNTGYSERIELHKPNWLQGWNFVTDMYRILEHSVDHLQRQHVSGQRASLAQALVESSSSKPQTIVLEHIFAMYAALSNQFKATKPITRNLAADLFSFQAANITATVQLIRVMQLANGQSTLEEKCQVAREVIAGFVSIPVVYLRAMSSPLLHHLAGIGTILGSAFEEGVTEPAYRIIRSILLDLTNLLTSLEAGLFYPSGTSEKMRIQVSRIDQYMRIQSGMATMQEPGQHVDHITPLQGAHIPAQAHGTNDSSIMTNAPHYHFPPELFEEWPWAVEHPSR